MTRSKTLKAYLTALTVALAGIAAAGLEPLPDREQDGYGVVSKASGFVFRKKAANAVVGSDMAAGEAYLRELRARPREKLTPLELQAEDMAEFALYRVEATTNDARRARCVKLLKKVVADGPTTIWGWSAYGFLADFNATNDVARPAFDPLLHLGEIAKGVIDFQPRHLEPIRRVERGAERLLRVTETKLPKGVPTEADLKPGTETRRAILRNELLRLCGIETVNRMLAVKGGKELFARLWDDDQTLEAFLLSGPVFCPAEALEMLMTFFLNDPDGWTATEEGRKITVASAVNVRPQGRARDARAEITSLNRLRCWAAYRRLSQRQRFHPTAARRDAREWRFIVRDPTNPAEILHLNSLPFDDKRPGRMIGYVPYRFRNAFGDHIQASAARYYGPWRFSDWPYWYKVHRVGGICNRQSTFAAVCANAHGLMAERAGQPNHCCWLRRDEEGVWRIHNDINKYTAGVFMFWGKGYQYIQANERAFGDREAWERSELLRFSGALSKAIAACPYNVDAWRDAAARLRADKAPARKWRIYLGELAARCPEGRTLTWELAFDALKELRALGETDDALLADLKALFAALPEPKKQIPEEMDFRWVVLQRSADFFAKDTARTLEIVTAALKENWGTPHNFTQVLRFGLDAFAKDRAATDRLITTLTEEAEKRGGRKGGETFDFRPLVNAASVGRRRDAFQTLVRLRDRLTPPPSGKRYPEQDFGGAKLVSADGLLYTSRSGKWDRPEDYGRVIDLSPLPARNPCSVVAAPVESAWAEVELPGICTISGVRVIGEKGAIPTVAVSEDGANWTTLATAPGKTPEEVRADCTKAHPKAQYVRITAPGGAALRLAKVLVYGSTHY